MGIEVRKARLIAWIETVVDEEMLIRIEDLAFNSTENGGFTLSPDLSETLKQGKVYQLTAREEALLLKAKEEIIQGYFYSQREVELMAEKWLEPEMEANPSPILQLTTEEEAELMRIRAEMIEGSFMTDEEADAELERWVEK